MIERPFSADRRSLHYLLRQADETYQLGLICLATRQEMVTRTLGAYS